MGMRLYIARVAYAWRDVAWLASSAARLQPRVKALIAVGCIGMAAVWMFQRARPIMAIVS